MEYAASTQYEAASLPTRLSQPFFFCTGIENSYPTIKGPDGSLRRDQMAECKHYERWREDFALVRETGLKYLRYGPPYYRVHLGPGKYDWSFADETFHALRDMGIVAIADLCHFGVPDWLGDFQNPAFPRHFAEYARAFAQRYSWLNLFTPVNEMLIAADFSAARGYWNERLSSDRAFVTALKHLVEANIRATEAIRAVRPDAWFVQNESTQYFHPHSPDALDITRHLNERRFLSFDLNYAKVPSARMYQYLTDNGMTRDEFTFFMNNQTRPSCIMGSDYYETDEHIVYPDGRTESCHVLGYYGLARQYYSRYRLPIMLTETNELEHDGARHWLDRQWANVLRLRDEGYPIIGFTWYSLIDQVDWDVAMREWRGHVNPLGLYDMDRKIRPVGEEYMRIVHDWQDLLAESVIQF
jgi:beta-glucosidase